MYHDIIVIGGGASGILTAIIAKDRGLDVAILEGTDRIGKKILTTGNGRCNITNSKISDENFHCSNNLFFKSTINKFSNKDTLDFFYSLGLPTIELEDGKIYPLSLQASSVVDTFRMALNEREIPLYTNSKVKTIKTNGNIFSLITNSNETFSCKQVVLSCGGSSSPNTGSDGSGMHLAKNLGHNIITPVPGLVQLKLNHNRLKALSGIKFNGNCTAYVNNKPITSRYGEILFTDYGISGPPILQISSVLSRHIYNKENVCIEVDFIPDTNKSDLKTFFENHWGMFNYRSVVDSLTGILNKKLIPVILKEARIVDIHKPCLDLTWEEKSSFLSLLKNWRFEVYDTNSFKNSQVTCGGVNTKNVDPDTLESKLVPNLYFTGEILDVDGMCGGFNLQWAWSSAYVVATSLK